MKQPTSNLMNDQLQIQQERSIFSCLFKGLKFVSDYYTSLFRFLWPASVAMFLLPIPGCIVLAGRVDAYIAAWQVAGVPPVLPASAMVGVTKGFALRRTLHFVFFLAVLLSLVGVPLLFAALGIGLWYALPCVVLLLAFLLPISRPLMQVSFVAESPVHSLSSYCKGFKDFWLHFSFESVSALVCALILFVGTLPFTVLLMVFAEYRQTISMGDAASLPSLMPLFFFLAYAVASLVLQHVVVAYIIGKCLFLGSLLTREKAVS